MMVRACLRKSTIVYLLFILFYLFLRQLFFIVYFIYFLIPKTFFHCVRHYNLLNYIFHYESLSHTKNECTFPSLNDLVLLSLSFNSHLDVTHLLVDSFFAHPSITH